VDPERFHLIAPYDGNPACWEDLSWRNLHDPHGPTYRAITTRWDRTQHDRDQPADLVQLQSYRHVLLAYTRHPEHKADGPDGARCGSDTAGLLRRRTVQLANLHHIGKEANRLDDIEAGIISSQDEVLTNYSDPTAAFVELVIPALESYSTGQLAEHTGLSEREIQRVRAASAVPNRTSRETLTRLAVDATITDLNNAGIDHPWKDTWPSTAYGNAESILSQWRDTRTNPRVCPCNCGAVLRPRQSYASEACRRRVARRG